MPWTCSTALPADFDAGADAVLGRSSRTPRALLERAIERETARWFRLAEGTVKEYKRALRTLREELEALDGRTDLSVAAERAIARWTPARRHICSKLYKRLGLDVEVVRQPRPRPKPLATETWQRLIEAYQKARPRGWRQWRNRAIILTIATTGRRPVDVLSADLDDWHRPRLDLVQKGGWHITIEVPDEAASAIDDWLRHRPRDAGCEALFIGRANGAAAYKRLTPKACSYMFAEEQLRRRLPKARLKDFRTTVATELADEGPHIVAAALGHRSLATAQFYVDPTLRQAEASAMIAAKLRRTPQEKGPSSD